MSKEITSQKKTIKVSSLFFFAFLLYFIFILSTVFLNLFCKIVKLPQNSFFSVLIALLIIFLPVFKLRNKIYAPKLSCSRRQFLIGFIIITIVSVFKIIYPDNGFDTFHYQLIAQRPTFTNYFSAEQGFARGNFQVWASSLGSKSFWYFRVCLGYRLGTILNSITLFLVYTQFLGILSILFPPEKQAASRCITVYRLIQSLFGIFLITSHYIVLNTGTYMVDALALPFILECLFLLLTAEKQKNSTPALEFSILCGLLISLKLTNIIYAFPLALAYILSKKKTITLKVFLICVSLAILPSMPFFIYNYHITRNPVFPWFNSIFQSEYFPRMNFVDTRWGPQSTLQKFIWGAVFAFFPKHRLSEIPCEFNFLYQLGLIGLTFWFISFAKKPESKEENLSNLDYLGLVTISCTVLWGFTSGYARYFEGGMLFLAIYAYYFFDKIMAGWQKNIRPSLLKATEIVCLIMLMVQSISTLKSFEKGREWSWRSFDISSYKQNCKLLLKDRSSTKGICMEPYTFFITDSEYCGIADSAFPKAKIINTSYINSFAQNQCSIEDYIQNTIYDIRDRNFVPDDKYTHFFENLGLYLNATTSLELDYGNFMLIEFKKNTKSN